MSKLAQYLERVSQEDAEAELDALSPDEVAVNEVVEEAELDIPETPEEPVTDEVIEAAEVEAVDATEEQAVEFEAVEEAAVVTEEVEEEIESLEHFSQVLQHGLKTKTFSPQFAAVVSHKLDKLNATFGGRQETPSLEDFGGDDLEQYYVASLESFTGFLKRLYDLGARALNAIPEAIANGSIVKGYQKQAAALVTKIDAATQALADVENSAVAGGQSVPKALAVEGSDLFAGLEYDVRLTTAAATKGLRANANLLEGAIDVLIEANVKGGVGKTGQIVAKAAQLPSAIAAYPTEAFEKGFAGGSKLTKEEDKEDADTRTKIKALAKGGVPGVAKGKTDALEAVDLKKGDIARILKLAKVYAQLGAKAADDTGSEVVAKLKQVGTATIHSKNNEVGGGAQATTWGEGKDLDALATALPKLTSNHVKVYRFLVDHAMQVSEELLSLAEKATKKVKVTEA